MSRNIAKTTCDHCGSRVVVTGRLHPITKEEAHVYFKEFEGLIVADAECSVCRAKYIAWCDYSTCRGIHNDPRRCQGVQPFWDLSYRSTFNDEPGDKDLVYDVEWVPKLTLRKK